MVVVLLTFKKKKPRYGCCPTDIFKSLDMVVVLLAFLKKSRLGCRPAGTFKIKKSRHGCCPAGIFKKFQTWLSSC